ncbi:hypothetical protein J4456_01960 [Candidatus Pacearchaeota archaeon]|nr:hypothetical protein [Candidatus Pacearchaeota archaeon]
MHLKRSSIGKFWPLPRKGNKYLAVSSHDKTKSIPLVVVIRDILQLVGNRKELQKLINEKQILINQRLINDKNYPICLFDVITIPTIKKNYRALLSSTKKINFVEISDKESEKRVYKVIDKKVLKKNTIQINLINGRNIITKEKINVNDSIVMNLKQNKIDKILKIEGGKNAYVTEGKHAGAVGKIDGIVERGGKKLIKITTKDNKKINVWIKNVIVMD